MSSPTDLPSKQPKKVHVKLDCDVCGKPIKPKNKGSLTSWIFGEESVTAPKDLEKFCRCDQIDYSKPFGRQAVEVAGAHSSSSHPDSHSIVAADSSSGRAVAKISNRAFEDDQNVGRLIANRYQMLAVVGQGGMSTVYEVHDNVLNKRLALKMLRKELTAQPTSLKRFEQEANAIRSLTHPHLATVYDYGRTEDESPYLVMEYIEGDRLSDLIHKEIFVDTPRALAICLQICTAVSYAHEHGVIHRDLKPENIILTNADEDGDFVKLIDFGIAKIQSESGLSTQKVTQTGEIFGSPLYMSPEQCMGYPLDVRSDVYSIGCVMYELVTGKPPLAGENSVQTIFKHLNETPPPISLTYRQLDVPRGFESLIMKSLQKKPEDRYQTVDDLRQDLKLVWLGKEPGKALVASKSTSSEIVPFWKSRTLLYVVLTAATTYGVVVSVWLWSQMNQKPQAAQNYHTPSNGVPNAPNGASNAPSTSNTSGNKSPTPGATDPSSPDVFALGPALLREDAHERLKTYEPAKLGWRFAQQRFPSIEFDIKFNNDLPKGPVIFLRLYEGQIGKHHIFLGFQTDLHDPTKLKSPGRGMIFSRWGTDNLANARAIMPGGFAEASINTPFVGIRRLYPWTSHHYKVRLAQGERDQKGIWYVLTIEDLDTGVKEEMGALKFPKEDGNYPLIYDQGDTMVQILRGIKYQKDVPQWHISFNKVRIGDDPRSEQNVNVDYKQSDIADVFVKHEGRADSSIEVFMRPFAKNQTTE